MLFGACQVLGFGRPAHLWPGLQIMPSLSLFFLLFPWSRTLISCLGRKHSCRGRSGRGLPPCVQIFLTLVLALPLLPPSSCTGSSASGLFLWERDPESLQGWGRSVTCRERWGVVWGPRCFLNGFSPSFLGF